MTNLRIVYDNAIDRAEITSTSQAGTLGPNNLKSNRKYKSLRSVGTTQGLRARWTTSPEMIDGVYIPFCNLSNTASKRVRVTDEVTKTNKFSWSDNLYSSLWQLFSVTVRPYYASAPDGTTRVYKIVEGAVPTSRFEFYRPFAPDVGQRQTLSIFVKAAERTKISLALVRSGYTLGASAIFDLLSGTVSPVTHYGSSTGGIAKISPAGNDWYRCSIEFTPTTNESYYLALDLVIGTNTITYTGDGVSGVYACLAQCESGTLSSYYPSTTTFSSRSTLGSYYGSNGILQQAPVNMPRMQYNPLDLSVPPYLLIEPTANNIFTYSEGTVAQLGGYIGGITNATVSILGFANSLQFPSNDNSINRYCYRGSVSFGTLIGTAYTISAYIQMDDNSAPKPGASNSTNFDFSWVSENGAFSTPGIVTHVGNNIYRCSFTFIAQSTGSNINGVSKYIGQSLKGFRITGLQMQLGPYADSYIPTTTAYGTRGGDVATSVAATRPLGYIDTWQSYSYDSGWGLAYTNNTTTVSKMTYAQSLMSYAYGGGSKVWVWLPSTITAYGVSVDIIDTNNPNNFIDISRVIAGKYWSPKYNTGFGMSAGTKDQSTSSRTDAGDSLPIVSTKFKELSFNLDWMDSTDRDSFNSLMISCGTTTPMWVSLFPSITDTNKESLFQIYGTISEQSRITHTMHTMYSGNISINEV